MCGWLRVRKPQCNWNDSWFDWSSQHGWGIAQGHRYGGSFITSTVYCFLFLCSLRAQISIGAIGYVEVYWTGKWRASKLLRYASVLDLQPPPLSRFRGWVASSICLCWWVLRRGVPNRRSAPKKVEIKVEILFLYRPITLSYYALHTVAISYGRKE